MARLRLLPGEVRQLIIEEALYIPDPREEFQQELDHIIDSHVQTLKTLPWDQQLPETFYEHHAIVATAENLAEALGTGCERYVQYVLKKKQKTLEDAYEYTRSLSKDERWNLSRQYDCELYVDVRMRMELVRKVMQGVQALVWRLGKLLAV